MDEFTTTFNDFIRETEKVIPVQHKGDLLKVKIYIHTENPENILLHFFSQLKLHQNDVLSKNDIFIDKIKQKFPLLATYDSLDVNSKSVTLEYLKVLYLLAYQFVEKNI